MKKCRNFPRILLQRNQLQFYVLIKTEENACDNKYTNTYVNLYTKLYYVRRVML